MPRRRLNEELVLEEHRRVKPELKHRRENYIRSDEIVVRECERGGARYDAREDSRAGFVPRL
jgi:hypothetical protein